MILINAVLFTDPAKWLRMNPGDWRVCANCAVTNADPCEDRCPCDRLLLMINLEQRIPGTRQYVIHKRGVFKTTMSRQQEFRWTTEAKKEIDVTWAALKPYLID